MASHTIAADAVRVTFTLSASTVDTVTIAEGGDVVILSDGTAAVDFTVDGSTPTAAGAGTFPIPAAVSTFDVDATKHGYAGTIKLISSGTPTLTVYRS